MSVPEVLESSDIQALLVRLDSCSRLMITLAVTTGLRPSELFALRWGDVNFSDLEIFVRRSIYRVTIGDCKTETSRKPVPVNERIAADLWLWKETSTATPGSSNFSRASRRVAISNQVPNRTSSINSKI